MKKVGLVLLWLLLIIWFAYTFPRLSSPIIWKLYSALVEKWDYSCMSFIDWRNFYLHDWIKENTNDNKFEYIDTYYKGDEVCEKIRFRNGFNALTIWNMCWKLKSDCKVESIYQLEQLDDYSY